MHNASGGLPHLNGAQNPNYMMNNPNIGGNSMGQDAQMMPGPSNNQNYGNGHPNPGLNLQPRNYGYVETPSYQMGELEAKIHSLIDDSLEDKQKLTTLHEIWGSIEHGFTSNVYAKVVDKLVSTFMTIFCNTSPQFIAENNTQIFRKLILELILRMSNIEAMKSHAKEVMKQMMRLIAVENEENAILAIKIIVEQGRNAGKMTHSSEVMHSMAFFRKMMMELTQTAIQRPDIFENKDPTRTMGNVNDDTLIAEQLKNCYHVQMVTLSNEQKYTLIPMAGSSVKLLQEIPMLVVFFFQHHRGTQQSDVISENALDFLRLGLDFLNLSMPRDMEKSKSNYNIGLVVDFVTAQSKFLTFVNIMTKMQLFMDLIMQHAPQLISGSLQLLEHCPSMLTSVRKEILLSIKFFTTSELRSKFLPMLPRMISERVMLGNGFTSIDSLRTFMYQSLADLFHHTRSTMGFDMLSHIAFVFSRQLHDPSTNTQVQIMSARLLNSVTECVAKVEGTPQSRDLIIDILESLVIKLKMLAVYHLPPLFEANQSETDHEYQAPERKRDNRGMVIRKREEVPKSMQHLLRQRTISIDSVEEMELNSKEPLYSIGEKSAPLPHPIKEGKQNSPDAILTSLFAMPAPPAPLSDCRNLVKFLMQSCKFAVQSLKDTPISQESYSTVKEKDLFERLLKYGVLCMDVYVIPLPREKMPTQPGASRSKEEKDALEALASCFTCLDSGVFREIFNKYMDFLVERIYRNFPLQLIVNTFLVRNEVPIFANIMLTYLMQKIPLLAQNSERTMLYVKLFKIIFSAIGTHSPNLDGERMLKPFLPELIRHATNNALGAREPLNYFLLLRALFRSIGGGAHDILYSKFLPLLPNLLQFLNKLQSCQHRLQMRELFIELCLTVPVRLSSLLPYLPLLMDPLVCALNGSQSLVQQGLRTLELCVDNLQPDFFFEHMLPVRGALMQGLWKVVATSGDTASISTAFRILGKFGGANRKMLCEPQMIQIAELSECCPAYVNMEFTKNGQDGDLSLHLPLSEVIKQAVETMRIMQMTSNDGINPAAGLTPLPQPPSYALRRQSLELARSILLAGLGPSQSIGKEAMKKVRLHLRKLFVEHDGKNAPITVYQCGRENDRELFVNALLAFFPEGLENPATRDAAARQKNARFFDSVVKQLTMNGLIEYISGNDWIRVAEEEGLQNLCMDSTILIDAIAAALSDTNRDFVSSALIALRHLNNVCRAVLKNSDEMSQIPFCKYLVNKITSLCHGPAYFTRLGGTTAIGYFTEKYPLKFLVDFLPSFIDGYIEIVVGCLDEISTGSADLAMEGLEKLHLRVLAYGEHDPNLIEERKVLFIRQYMRYFFYGSDDVRFKFYQLLRHVNDVTRTDKSYQMFLSKYKQFLVADIERTLANAPNMSVQDGTNSLAAFSQLIEIEPPIYEYDRDIEVWNRFIAYLLDISQTKTKELMKRQMFKKCETCASHFLPPLPISEQIDILRTKAIRCIVKIYKWMRVHDKTQKDDGNQKIDVDVKVEKVLIEHVVKNYHMLGVVGLRSAMAMNYKRSMFLMVHRALRKSKPFPVELLTQFGEEYVKRVEAYGEEVEEDENGEPMETDDKNEVDDKEDDEPEPPKSKKATTMDVLRVTSLFDLNSDFGSKKLCEKLVDFVCDWKLDERITSQQVNGRVREEDEALMDALKKESWRQVDAVLQVIEMCSVLTPDDSRNRLTAEMTIKMAKFAAGFQAEFAQDVLKKYNQNIAVIVSKFPRECVEFFFTAESLQKAERRMMFRKQIVYESTITLRRELMRNTQWIEKVLEGKAFDTTTKQWVDTVYDERELMDKEQLVLFLIENLSKMHTEWLFDEDSPIPKLKELWNSPQFKKRYVVRSPQDDDMSKITVRFMTEHKFKVPKLIINTFLRYLRFKHNDIELLFDVITVFIGNFITEFYYVREFLENEIIPVVSIEWRRRAFNIVMDMFEENPEKTVSDLRVVKAIQYIVLPCLQWAFERYDSDEIVGSAPTPDANEDDPNNLVSRLAKVVDRVRSKVSDSIVIVLYQLCTLFVQHAPSHIHNNNCKKQGGRLRVFMLFAWPVLSATNFQDPTIRYTGFLFLANIIEKFTINKKIVLQVFSTLSMTYQPDTREQIRKAIDILTPSVPLRMDDGYKQLRDGVKSIFIEQSHNLLHIQHAFQMVIRNYRVYFHIRHELLVPMMHALQRTIVAPNNVGDQWTARRLAVEVCEMVIKWDLIRLKKLDQQKPSQTISEEEASEIDRVLERLKASSATTIATEMPREKPLNEEEMVAATLARSELEETALRPIPKEHIDTIINMLVKFCITFGQVNQPAMQGTANELVRRSQMILKAALKSCVWGEVATIRTQQLERYLNFAADVLQALRPDPAQMNAHCQHAQNTLELLISLTGIMPKQLLLQTMKPLQRVFISILNAGITVLVRSVNQLLCRLLEKTKTSQNGMDELEVLNQYLHKFLNDQFNNATKSQNHTVGQYYTAFSILRTMCMAQPAFMETVVLQSFVKVTEKACKEHLNYIISGQDASREKGTAELVYMCLELIRSRVDYIQTETKRLIAYQIMTDVVKNTTYDRVVEGVLKLAGAMINPSDMEISMGAAIPLLVEVQTQIEKKFKNNTGLVNIFLEYVLRVYGNPDFRISEVGNRLWIGFFWGLTHQNSDIRSRFLIVWESTWPNASTMDMKMRMRYILQQQDWSKFGQYFWLRHALWSMLRGVGQKGREEERERTEKGLKFEGIQRKRVMFLNAASPWKTFELAARLKDVSLFETKEEPMETDPAPAPAPEAVTPSPVDEVKQELPEENKSLEQEPMKEPNEEDPEDEKMEEGEEEEDFTNMTEHDWKVKRLVDEQMSFLEEASNFDFSQTIDTVAHIAFGTNDTKFTSNCWIMLFKSFWASLTPEETAEFHGLIIPFLSSGCHNTYLSGVEKSVLAVWVEAVSHVIQLPPGLVEFIASKHECWHTGIKLLEQSALTIPKMLNNPDTALYPLPPELKNDLDTLDSLAELYTELGEFDQFAAVWDKRAVLPETMKMMGMMQLNDLENAQTAIESSMIGVYESLLPSVMKKANLVSTPTLDMPEKHVTPVLDKEYDLWSQMHINAASELIQWQTVADTCNGKEMQEVRGLLAASIHIPDWNVAEECKNQIRGSIPYKFYQDFTVYNSMVTIVRCMDTQSAQQHRENIKKALSEAFDVHIARWRALPKVVTYAHVKILQMMNLLRELDESSELRVTLEEPGNKCDGNLLHDMKNLIKTWRARGLTASDDMVFISTLFDWRMQIHQLILQRFEYWDKITNRHQPNQYHYLPQSSPHAILPIHSSAQGQLLIAKTARNFGFWNTAKDALNKIAGMQLIPTLDSHQKVCDYAKTLRNQALSTTDDELRRELFMEAIEVLEDIKVTDLTNDQIARLLFHRGNLHSLCDHDNHAEVAFSAAAQLVDFKPIHVQPLLVKFMKTWGHHMYKMFFFPDVIMERAVKYGPQALTCYFTAARVDAEPKARKYIARILWIAKHMYIYGTNSSELLNKIIMKFLHTINVFNWVYWIPQLISDIKHRHDSHFIFILIKLIPTFPMQVFYHLRDAMPLAAIDKIMAEDDEETMSAEDKCYLNRDGLIRLVKLCLKYRPTDIRVFHRMLRELDQSAEYWVERQLRYAIYLKDHLFNDLSKRMDAKFNEIRPLTTETLKMVRDWRKRLMEDVQYYELNFGKDRSQLKDTRPFTVKQGFCGGTNVGKIIFEKELDRLPQVAPHEDEEFKFVNEMSSSMIRQLQMFEELKLHPRKMTDALLKWITALKRRLATLPAQIPLELTSQWLSKYSHRLGCVEMPFDLLNVIRVRNINSPSTNQSGQYVSMVSRFETKVNIIVRGGQMMRRINIRGQTGKACAFYFRKFIRPERTNRVPQLFAHIHTLLCKDRETARRHLHVPTVTLLKSSKYSQLQEVATIQPYLMPSDSGLINPPDQVEIIHPIDIFAQSYAGTQTSPDSIVQMFYDRFSQSADSIGPPPTTMVVNIGEQGRSANREHQTQPHHIMNIIYEDFVRDVVPNRILYDYLMMRYPDSSMYFMMRKQFVRCLSVLSMIEAHCNLTPFNADQMIVSANTGVLVNPRYCFELAPKGSSIAECYQVIHQVPFRLTPNLATFIGIAQEGDLMWSMAATAKCLSKRSPDVILRPLLWDEHADNVESENMRFVCQAANSFVKGVMKRLTRTTGQDAQMSRDDIASKIVRAKDSDNLARMPPTYHPWF